MMNAITSAWLTERLRLRGYLLTVKDIDVTKVDATNSTRYHLKVTFKEDTDLIPTKLFLKVPAENFRWLEREVQFYRDIVPAMQAQYSDLPFVRCYDFEYSPNTSHLLMDDLSETHFTFSETTRPNQHHFEQVIDGFARLHAYWWEHPQLGKGIGQRLSAEMIAAAEQEAQKKIPAMADFLLERFSAKQIETLTSIASNWPTRRRDRVINGQGITLVHRDPHPYNFLYPRGDGQTKIIDWQSWRVDTGTDDLAYMMPCNWDAALRAEIELRLLQRYHARLIEYGVTNYAWVDCLYDYQASIVRCLFFLINAWNAQQRELKLKRIERGLLAFDQFNCAEILH